MSVLRRIDQVFTRWLTAPEKNAAGRISAYRVIYGLFYLWLTPTMMSRFQRYDLLTAREWDPIFSLRWFNPAPPDPLLIAILNGVLVASLILLTIGFKTKWANLLVLLTGVALTAIHFSYTSKIDHGNTFMVAYIPAIMLFGNWGQCYSLDAILKHRAGKTPVDPHSDSWQHIWPMRIVLLLLALMFCGSGYLKISNGQWISDPQLMRNMFLIHNIVAVDSFFGPNPLNPIIADIPPIYLTMHVCALAFETLFPLALINRHWRGFFAATGVIFHSINYFFFAIGTTPMLILYLLFVDWQAIIDRVQPRLKFKSRTWSPPLLIGLALGSVALGVLLWIRINPVSLLIPDAPVQWFIAAPIALFFMAKNGLALLQGGLNRVRHKKRMTDSTADIVQQQS